MWPRRKRLRPTPPGRKSPLSPQPRVPLRVTRGFFSRKVRAKAEFPLAEQPPGLRCSEDIFPRRHSGQTYRAGSSMNEPLTRTRTFESTPIAFRSFLVRRLIFPYGCGILSRRRADSSDCFFRERSSWFGPHVSCSSDLKTFGGLIWNCGIPRHPGRRKGSTF